MLKISVIIPTLNEAAQIQMVLNALAPWRAAGHEIIVVDGGSRDNTVALAGPLADVLLHSAPGRARQMNLGAAQATGELLLFLHADSLLPVDAEPAVLEAIEKQERLWGRFDVRLSGHHPLLTVVAALMNLRSCLSGIATGDQAIFVRREVFERIGAYPPIALMEDIALSRRLKRLGRPACVHSPLLSSSRRWESRGILRTIALMWWLRLAYFLGADPKRLARWYRDARESG